MQRIPVVGTVAQHQRRGARLAGAVAGRQPLVEAVRPRRGPAQPGPPVAGDRQEPGVKRLFEGFDRLGIRSAEVPVLPGAVPSRGHVDRLAEQAVVGVEIAQPGRLAGCHQSRQ